MADQPQPRRARRSGGRGDPVRGGHGLGGHLDDLGERPPPELHAEVDGLDDATRRAGGGRGLVRRGRQQHAVVRRHTGSARPVLREGGRRGRGHRALQQLRQRRVPGFDPPVEDAGAELRRRPGQRLRRLLGVDASLDRDPGRVGRIRRGGLRAGARSPRLIDGGRVVAIAKGQPDEGVRSRLSAFLFRHPRLKLGLSLGAPLTWLLVVYIGSLLFLLANAFWSLDVLTSQIVRGFSFDNFQTLWENDVYRTITIRTMGIAAAVTITDIVLSFPLAYYAARLATPRVRNALLVAVVLPLWANYLVRVFAWKIMLTPNGFVNWLAELTGLGHLQLGNSNWAVWLTFVYLWLPFTLLPIYAALERVPASYLEASSDLGAKGWRTFRSVLFPLILPGIAAGSIFAFSLTLGDYITPELVGTTQFIGNVIYDNVGVAGNTPLAAAFALVPIAIMAVYLLGAKRAGAFEAL